MPFVIDIGGAPASEPCAQLGQTPDFERINKLEVAAYRAAIIAQYGSPPAGCALVELRNPHDFGTYYTLGVRVDDDDATIGAAADYLNAVEEGLGTWLEAGFSPPVTYDGDGEAKDVRKLQDIIISALLITRPGPDGRFALADFQRLHGNLTSAYPAEACAAL